MKLITATLFTEITAEGHKNLESILKKLIPEGYKIKEIISTKIESSPTLSRLVRKNRLVVKVLLETNDDAEEDNTLSFKFYSFS
ncbi:RNase P/RNase MRP subunit p30 [Dysgonomonas sp. PH5-45]|uniref:hypothetical protein n=1 Tax=unclassified Dysgonomonas TaxID=2630389 RepID=UPI002473783B|nr:MULTISPECIES: hypothetical protein [unclassified Dysgonomonas]MDH6354504.1 RNase P/RNase MRP subunit p30 [Dysgonomonas sp. PH5-45]MDH6387439.1 RNase P/RNase MRP subunit p30 [Dysgonomonas sp. PH5-37]